MRRRLNRWQGYQIGTGLVKNVGKCVVGLRINQAGMGWSARGAEAMVHLRALVLTQCSDAFWRQRRPPQRHYHSRQAQVA